MSSNFRKANISRLTVGNDSGGLFVNTGVTSVTRAYEYARVPRRIAFGINNLVVPVLAAADFGTVKLLDLPNTNILILGAETRIVVTKGGVTNGIVAATDINISIGTTATADTTLNGTDVNIIASTALTADTLAVDFNVHNLAATFAGVGVLDSGTSALHVNLTATITADDAVTLNGTLFLTILDLGNGT